MVQAVDLQRMQQNKKMMEAQNRGNMYSLAASILVHNSGTFDPPELVEYSLQLAQEFYRQVSDLDQKLIKQLEEKESSNGGIITG